jgi:Rieske Fe-S protein
MPLDPIENDPTTEFAPGSSMLDEHHPFNRRRALQGVAGIGVLGIAGSVLAACGSDEPDTTAPSASSDNSQPAASETESGGDESAADAVASTSDVPVGGGLILEDPEAMVITQPADGDFHAFTAICTHQGCVVGSVENNVIKCPCHGSQYDATTGEVVGGPAPKALAPIEISVEGDSIALA